MVLDAPCIRVFYPDAFDGVVVHVNLGDDCSCAFEGIWVDRIAVILAGDRYLSVFEVFDGVVATSVSKLKFVSLTANGMAQQLVSKADAKDGSDANEVFHRFDDGAEALWVTRSGAQQYSVGIVAEDFVGRGVARDHDRSTSCTPKPAEDIELQSAVKDDQPWTTIGVFFPNRLLARPPPFVGLFTGYLKYEIAFVI